MRYIKDIQIFNEALNFVNENKQEIIKELDMWNKLSTSQLARLNQTLQGFDKVEFTEWNGTTHIVKVKELYIDPIYEDDEEDKTVKISYGIIDSEGNHYTVDNYQPIYGL